MKQKCNILIPMAGRGSRFEEQGYTDKKPFIDVNGKPMIHRVIKNLGMEFDKEYLFIYVNLHPSVDNKTFLFNLSADGGSNYNVTKTTTSFFAYNNEADTSTSLSYDSATDLAQSTSYQILASNNGIGNDSDQSGSGYLQIFNPSSSVFVNHFISRFQYYVDIDYTKENYIAGYGNTTSAINGIQFKCSSGNIDDGIIKMYGVA